MKNEVINLAIEQIKSKDINRKVLKLKFFDEYYKRFRNGNKFEKVVIDDINNYRENEKIYEVSNKIISSRTYRKVERIFFKNEKNYWNTVKRYINQ